MNDIVNKIRADDRRYYIFLVCKMLSERPRTTQGNRSNASRTCLTVFKIKGIKYKGKRTEKRKKTDYI